MYDNDAARFIRSHCSLIGEGIVSGRLFDLGTYPGLVYEPKAQTVVKGEVYKIHSNEKDLIQYLDNFEECGPYFEQPNEYRKEIIPVLIKENLYHASTYIYNRTLDGLTLIENGNYNNKSGTR